MPKGALNHFLKIPRIVGVRASMCHFSREELIFIMQLATEGGGATQPGADVERDFEEVFGPERTQSVLVNLQEQGVIERTQSGYRLVNAFDPSEEGRNTARKPIGNAQRFRILNRDGFKCRYCGQGAPQVQLEVDHVVPVAKGGTNDEVNLITSCLECNRGKHVKSVSEASDG